MIERRRSIQSNWGAAAEKEMMEMWRSNLTKIAAEDRKRKSMTRAISFQGKISAISALRLYSCLSAAGLISWQSVALGGILAQVMDL